MEAPQMAEQTDAPIVQPKQTIYIQNIPHKLKKEITLSSLYMLFSTYGPIIGVQRRLGQAYISYKDITSAVAAQRALDGTEFFGRSLRVGFAKSNSKSVDQFENEILAPARRDTLLSK